jgi:hypothetical protein
MTPDQELFLAFLKDQLTEAFHTRDSALQIARTSPDWRAKMQEALRDPARQAKTEVHLGKLLRVLDGFREGCLDDEKFAQLVEELRDASENEE